MKRVAIHSVPRSGSSWVGQIFNSSPDVIFSYQPLFSYEFKGALDQNSSADDIHQFFREIAISTGSNEFLSQKDKVEAGIYPHFLKHEPFTHIVYKEVRYHHLIEHLLATDDEVVVVGILRNPFAVIDSFLRAPKEFRRDLGWVEEEEWRKAEKKNLGRAEEFFGFEKWKEVALLFDRLGKTHPSRFSLLEYSSALRDTAAQVKSLFEFCELPFSRQTAKFIADSRAAHNSDAYSVYKFKTHDVDWMNSLKPAIALAINDELTGGRILEQYKLSEKEIRILEARV